MNGHPPTDLELMLYADGELDGERLAEVEAWLEGDRDGRAKLAALGLISSVVRERALETSSRADDLADAVMDRIDREVAAPTPKPPAQPVANDNGRFFFVIAAAVVAAAAAVLLWSRPAPAPVGPVAQTTAATPGHDGGLPHAPEADVEHGVEVAAVDFGSTTGAVFYVPNGTSPSDTTTLVWLSDDGAGEEDE